MITNEDYKLATASHIVPTTEAAIANPWDHKLTISPFGWSLQNINDDAISTFVSMDDAKKIAYVFGKAGDDAAKRSW